MPTIYDVGSNNGDDIPYYLLKGDLVVAIEADPSLANIIREKYADPIREGRLHVENFVATADSTDGLVPFYLHRGHHVLNQLGKPAPEQAANFDQVELPTKRLVNIIKQYGDPYYVKIDVEGYDQYLLEDLFANDVFPPYLSAEAHSVEVYASLIANGKYKSFKLVDGPSIPQVYYNHPVERFGTTVFYSFPDHSAGPFGNDIIGPWQTASTFLQTLARANFGWKDIHVSRVDVATE